MFALIDLSLSISQIIYNFIKTQWENDCGPHCFSSSAYILLPSFVYLINCLQLFPPPYYQPYRNLAFNFQPFELVDMSLLGRNGEVDGHQKLLVIDLLS